MKCVIRYLVSVRDKTGKREEVLELPDGAILDDVSKWLRESYGLRLPHPALMSTLNGRGWNQYPEKMHTQLQDGDRICIFSPISGG